MKCCIIFNKPLTGALADELDVLDQVGHIEKYLKNLGLEVYTKPISNLFMDEVAQLAQEKPDFVFNLVESINNKGELNYFVPALLNMYSLPYSGNPLESIFITSSKILTGKTMKNVGILSPGAFKPSEMNLLENGKKYIIKPVWEDGSLGITADSVFECVPGYEKKLDSLDDAHWFIEDYIDGREFNISVLTDEKGPEVLPPAEIVFKNFTDSKPKIVDFKAKWEPESFEYINTVRNFPDLSDNTALKTKLVNTALKCWDKFGLKGYARIDIRCDINENVHVIEINANPCISPDSGFVAATEKAGYKFEEVLSRIIKDLN